MADKQATVYVLDLGSSMGEKHEDRQETDLEWALKYVWDKVTTTVSTGRKTDTIGVVGFRTDDSDNEMMADEAYKHITVLKPISQLLMPHLRELKEALKPSNTDLGDGISALVVAIQMITTYCKKLKYIRNICIVTNGTGSFDPDGIEEIAAQIKGEGMNLSILGVDFDDAEFGFKQEDKTSHKAKNEQILKNLCDDCNGIFGTLAEAISELGRPRLKKVRPVASFKGKLTLGDPETYDTALSIDVERYPRTMIAKPVSASQYTSKPEQRHAGDEDGSPAVVAAGETTESGELQGLKTSRVYQVDDPDVAGGKMDVDPETLEKGYSYGRTVVPISATDEAITVLETEPSLQIVGFIPAPKYQRYFSMSNTNVIVGMKANDKAIMALSSLIHALFELESYALARLVTKKNVPPVMVVMAPSIEADFECLIDVQVPFTEDVRAYKFAPLDRVKTITGKVLDKHRNLPTKDMEKAMSDYVDSMDLSSFGEDDEGKPADYAPVEDTFSPVLHRINQVIRWRAIHPNDPLSPVPESLDKYSHPPGELVEKSKSSLEKLIEACDIKKVPPKAQGKKARQQPTPKSGLDVDKLLNATPQKAKSSKISSSNAIPEFKRKLTLTDDVADLKDAANQMLELIKELITHSFADVNYARACEMLRVMREEYLECGEPGIYNEVIRELKEDVVGGRLGGERGDLWRQVRGNRLGLLTVQDSGVLEVTEEEAKNFLWD